MRDVAGEKKEDFEFAEAANLLSQTGFLLTKTNQYSEADRFLKRALEIREKLLDQSGGDQLGVAETLSHIGNNLQEWGKNTDALPYYKRALDIRIQNPTQGKDHTEVAQIHNDFGIAYYALSNNEKAIEHYLEALRIWRKGHDNNLIGTPLFGLAMICQNKTSEKKKAEEYFREAHEKITTQHMRAHVCRLYGSFLASNSRDDEALPLLYEGRKIAKMCFGDESEMILRHAYALVPVLRRLGRKEELKEIKNEIDRIEKR